MKQSECICCANPELVALSFRDQFDRRPLWQCRRCRHIQVEGLPSARRLQRFYADEYSRQRSMFIGRSYRRIMKARAKAQLDLCEQWTQLRIRSVLDVGCGYGALIAEANNRGACARGLEFDPRAVRLCIRSGLSVEQIPEEMDIEARVTQLRPNLVVMSHVLEHLRMPERVLLACSGGLLLIEVPAYDARLTDQFEDQGGHLNFFNAESLGKLLDRLGFETLAAGTFGPSSELFWRTEQRWKRRLLRLVTRDYFFGQYAEGRPDGMWLRALVRGSSCKD